MTEMTDDMESLAQIKVSIDMHASGSGRFIARIALDCKCGKWRIAITLAEWSNLASITDSARFHLASPEHVALQEVTQ